MAPFTARASLGTGFLLLLAIVSHVYAQDPCNLGFNNGLNTGWFGLPSTLRNCLTNVAFSEATRQSTLDIINAQLQLYSFSDLVQGPIAPYNLQVNWPNLLNTINTTNYSNDYDFQVDVAELYARMLDAHLFYGLPSGYSSFTVYRPFRIGSRLNSNGDQVFIFSPASYFTSSVYTGFCTTASLSCVTPADYYGLEVVQINGMDPKTYLQQKMATYGLYIDPGVQYNEASVGNGFGRESVRWMRMPSSDSINIRFNTSSSAVSFYAFAYTGTRITSTSDITTANLYSSSKRSASQDALREADLQLLAQFQDFFSQSTSNTFKRESMIEDDVKRINAAKRAMERVEKRLDGSIDGVSSFGRLPVPLPVRFNQHLLDSEALNSVSLLWGQREEEMLILAPEEQKVTRDADVIVTSSQELSFATGNVGLFKAFGSADGSKIQYWSYNGTTVVKLASFFPSGDWTLFTNVLKSAVTQRRENGLSNNLILDVSSNGGGYICLAQLFLSLLAQNWTNHAFAGSDVLFMPYDLRKSSYNNDLFNLGYLNPTTDEKDPATGNGMGPAFYTSSVQKSFAGGSITGQYSQKFVWTDCGDSDWLPAVGWFDKILVVTDGRCGSACSLFTSALRQSNKVRLMSYGGYWGSDLDTSSFAGGNVENWEDLYSEVSQVLSSTGGSSSPSFPSSWLKHLPTSAVSTFNYREMFLKGDSTPRQFVRIPADFILPYWDPNIVPTETDLSQLSSSEIQIMANLYSSALPAFDSMPSGLAGDASYAAPPTDTSSAPPHSSLGGGHFYVVVVFFLIFCHCLVLNL